MLEPQPQLEESAVPESSTDDLALVRRCLEGCERSLSELIHRLECVPRLLASLNDKLSAHLTHEELADLTQDSLTAIWRKLGTFEGRSRLETWAYRFCFLELMNLVRAKHRGARALGRRRELDVEMPILSLPTLALELEEIERELQELGPPDATVIRLKHYENLTFHQIARSLGRSPNTVKTHYYRGLRRLRTRLGSLQIEDRR